ncbi:MAG: hypothetical protein ACM34I_02575 [bacterium]
MNVLRYALIVSGMAVAVAIFMTLDVTFDQFAQGSLRSDVLNGIELIFNRKVPGYWGDVISIALYLLIILIGGVTGNIFYGVSSRVINYLKKH